MSDDDFTWAKEAGAEDKAKVEVAVRIGGDTPAGHSARDIVFARDLPTIWAQLVYAAETATTHYNEAFGLKDALECPGDKVQTTLTPSLTLHRKTPVRRAVVRTEQRDNSRFLHWSTVVDGKPYSERTYHLTIRDARVVIMDDQSRPVETEEIIRELFNGLRF